MITRIEKWGKGYGIRISKELLNAFGIDNLDQQLMLTVAGGKLIVEKKEDVVTIETLFEGYDGNFKPTEIDWGEPVGREEW